MVFKGLKKGWGKKIVPGILKLVSMPFLLFEKGMSKKVAPGILRLVTMLFF